MDSCAPIDAVIRSSCCDVRLSNPPELREIVARRLELKAREILSGDQWDGLQEQVLNHLLDPWSAADEMLRGVGA